MTKCVLGTDDYFQFKNKLAASDCQRCSLSGSRTHLVVDRGNPKAKIMIIGEAPGAHEDQQARAFVGRAGKLLDGMLRELGFDTDRDCLIANVVKCRPPRNRPPRPEEAQACIPYLYRQIELVDPRLIVLLGATAVKHVLPEKKGSPMADEVGRCFESNKYPGRQLMVLYHPAYILRDPRKKPLMARHLGQLVDFWILANEKMEIK